LSAASDVFAEKGYRGATLKDIADRLGMLKGSLYYYIETKEDLLFEILRRSHLNGVAFVQESEDEARATPPERLEKLVRRWMEGLKSIPSDWAVSEGDLRHLHGERRREIVSLRSRIASVAENIIEAGIADGSFTSGVDPYVATATLYRVLNTTTSWYHPGLGADWQDVTDWYVQLILGGLRPPPSSSPTRRRTS
jgi:TetR/AcrR family transcriptional regulator, cholesterol catabolism regulator